MTEPSGGCAGLVAYWRSGVNAPTDGERDPAQNPFDLSAKVSSADDVAGQRAQIFSDFGTRNSDAGACADPRGVASHAP
jgi:hypothetical protein